MGRSVTFEPSFNLTIFGYASIGFPQRTVSDFRETGFSHKLINLFGFGVRFAATRSRPSYPRTYSPLEKRYAFFKILRNQTARQGLSQKEGNPSVSGV
jgi:hypothetical protein